MVKNNKAFAHILDLIDKGLDLGVLWISVLSSIVSYFFTVDYGNLLVFLYLLFLVHNQKLQVSSLINILFFYTLGLFSVHYYDMDKLSEIFILSILPIILIGLFLKYSKMDLKWFKVTVNFIANIIKKILLLIKLQVKSSTLIWFVFALIVGYIISFNIRDSYYIYGGVFLILLVVHFLYNVNGFNRFKMVSIVMITVFTLLFNLTMNRGLLLLIEQPLDYLYEYVPTILIPYLILFSYWKAVIKTTPSKTLMDEEHNEVLMNIGE